MMKRPKNPDPDEVADKERHREKDERGRRDEVRQHPGKERLRLRIGRMGKEEGTPGVVEHRDDQHHEDTEPVVRLIHADSGVIRQHAEHRPVYHLNDHRRESRRDVREAECQERTVSGRENFDVNAATIVGSERQER